MATLLLAALAGCAADSTGDGPRQTLTVFAASSLKAPFEELGARFEQDHPGTTITFSFSGSADLIAQLREGAPADVAATADQVSMDTLTGEKLVTAPTSFASNHLVLAVPPDNPAAITTFGDLARAGIRLVICAPEVPCGRVAAEVAQRERVTLRPVSLEASVVDVVGKVTSGEADAGLIYASDAVAAGDQLTTIEIPSAAQVPNIYLAAPTDSTNNLATAFVALVAGDAGRAVLTANGFGPP
ncbi:MAG: molybdate ABC transporter substrate-binding protein [Nocardioides sp.]